MRVQRVLAPNPGPYTGPGTNTYLFDGGGALAVIDPGPEDGRHLDAILDAVGDRSVTAVVVTHTHPDHAPLANPLARHLDVAAFGYAPGDRFRPDVMVGDGDVIDVGTTRLVAVHTPGHSADHLCLRAGRILFTGDHIMGGSSVIVEDVSSYMRSLERLLELDLERLYPGHGPEMERPDEVISWYLAHRREREAQILAAVAGGAGTVGEIVATVYRDVDGSLWPLAAGSVAAHLRKLAGEGTVVFSGSPDWEAPVTVAR